MAKPGQTWNWMSRIPLVSCSSYFFNRLALKVHPSNDQFTHSSTHLSIHQSIHSPLHFAAEKADYISLLNTVCQKCRFDQPKFKEDSSTQGGFAFKVSTVISHKERVLHNKKNEHYQIAFRSSFFQMAGSENISTTKKAINLFIPHISWYLAKKWKLSILRPCRAMPPCFLCFSVIFLKFKNCSWHSFVSGHFP